MYSKYNGRLALINDHLQQVAGWLVPFLFTLALCAATQAATSFHIGLATVDLRLGKRPHSLRLPKISPPSWPLWGAGVVFVSIFLLVQPTYNEWPWSGTEISSQSPPAPPAGLWPHLKGESPPPPAAAGALFLHANGHRAVPFFNGP
eukprot:3600001-Prymnesium_polylepis.1